jgi:hypothetical protein
MVLSSAPSVALAAVPAAPAAGMRKVDETRKLSLDVALNQGGELRGSVVQANGSGCVAARVVLTRNGQDAREVRTDAQGQYVIASVRPGVYRLAITHEGVETQKILRVWAKDTAPPAASAAAVVALAEAKSASQPSSTPEVARAQGPDGGFLGLSGNRLLIGAGVIGAAVAIPFIGDDDDEDSDDVILPNKVVNTPGTP